MKFLRIFPLVVLVAQGSDICKTNNCEIDFDGRETCTFTVKVDLFAGQNGQYMFEECSEDLGPSPTIGMEIGKSYKFVQEDASNYYQPLGFMYGPDEDVEPYIAPSSSSSDCENLETCPAPMYMVNGIYLGDYSNNAAIKPIAGGEDFGLEHYEPSFQYPFLEWASNSFSVYLLFDITDVTQDIVYYSQTLPSMNGRIKLLKDGEPVNVQDIPAIDYPAMPDPYDTTCGTMDTEGFQLPNSRCPETFVCDPPPEMQEFAGCIDSMNCALLVGTTTNAQQGNKNILYITQMIAKLRDEVNMAKHFIHSGISQCDDVQNQDDPDCRLLVMNMEIIPQANANIFLMNQLLEDQEWQLEDECVMTIPSESGCCAEAESCPDQSMSTYCVCKFDPFCCTAGGHWDKQCISEAIGHCGLQCQD